MRSPLHASSDGKISSGISCHFVSDVTKGELCIPPPLLEKLVVVDRFLTNFQLVIGVVTKESRCHWIFLEDNAHICQNSYQLCRKNASSESNVPTQGLVNLWNLVRIFWISPESFELVCNFSRISETSGKPSKSLESQRNIWNLKRISGIVSDSLESYLWKLIGIFKILLES